MIKAETVIIKSVIALCWTSSSIAGFCNRFQIIAVEVGKSSRVLIHPSIHMTVVMDIYKMLDVVTIKAIGRGYFRIGQVISRFQINSITTGKIIFFGELLEGTVVS